MSRKQLDAKFNKIVDEFASELSDNDKQRLVAAHELDMCYFKESSIQVMTMLKARGKFSSRNPEGLLDMADFLEKQDLIDKYSPKIEEFKSTKLRKVSSAVFSSHQYSNEEAISALDVTLGQVDVTYASSGLLQKICTKCKPSIKRTLSEKFDEVTQSLAEVKTKLLEIEKAMATSESTQSTDRATATEPESAQILTEVVIDPQQETFIDQRSEPPTYGNVGQLLQVAQEDKRSGQPKEEKQRQQNLLHQVLPVTRSRTWSTPPGTRRSDKPLPPPVSVKPSTPGNERKQQQVGSKKIPLMPPTVRQRKNPTVDVVPSSAQTQPPPVKPKPRKTLAPTAEDNLYDMPHSPTIQRPSPGDRTSGTFSTGGSDSGITNDWWPKPETRRKDHHYQPLLPHHMPTVQEEMIYAEPYEVDDDD